MEQVHLDEIPKEILDELNKLQESKDDNSISLEDVQQLSNELRKCDKSIINKFISEHKEEIYNLRAEFINEYIGISNDNPIKKQLIQDLKILSIEI